MCVNKVMCLRERMTVRILPLSNDIFTQYNMQSIRTSVETSAPFLSTIILRQYHIVAAAQNGPLAKCSIVILIQFCSFFPLLGTFFHSLFSHCGKHFSGMRLQQPFYFWEKIMGVADCGGLGPDSWNSLLINLLFCTVCIFFKTRRYSGTTSDMDENAFYGY